MGRPKKNQNTSTIAKETQSKVKRLTKSISKCKVDNNNNNAKHKTVDENDEPLKVIQEAPKRGRPKKNVQSMDNKEIIIKQQVSTRPKREASIKASALIIQTNEIEKSHRYNQLNEQEEELEKQPGTSNNNKQLNNEDSLDETIEIKSDLDSNQELNAKNSKKKLIINNDKIKILNLTVDNLAEHTKRAANLGPFNNNTREYILKWTDGWAYTDEKPFPVGEIPI